MSQTTMDITFRKVAPEANVHRFYRVIVTRNLLGESVCVSQWGRIGSCGQRREKTYNNATDAQLAGAASVLERLKRGYTVTPGLSFVDKSIEQAVALDYLCTPRRSSKNGPVRKTRCDPTLQLGAQITPRHLALWSEGEMPIRRPASPAQEPVRQPQQKKTFEDEQSHTSIAHSPTPSTHLTRFSLSLIQFC